VAVVGTRLRLAVVVERNLLVLARLVVALAAG